MAQYVISSQDFTITINPIFFTYVSIPASLMLTHGRRPIKCPTLHRNSCPVLIYRKACNLQQCNDIVNNNKIRHRYQRQTKVASLWVTFLQHLMIPRFRILYHKIAKMRSARTNPYFTLLMRKRGNLLGASFGFKWLSCRTCSSTVLIVPSLQPHMLSSAPSSMRLIRLHG